MKEITVTVVDPVGLLSLIHISPILYCILYQIEKIWSVKNDYFGRFIK